MIANLGFHASTYEVWTTLHSITNCSIEEKTVQELPFEWCYFLRFIEVKCHGKAPGREGGRGGGVLPMMAYSGRLRPKRGIFFSLQVYEREGISLVEVYKRVGKSVIWVCKRAQKG